MFDLGIQELIVIFIVALLVFGPKRLPEIGKTLGKGIGELKRSMQGVKEQMDAELREIKQPVSLDSMLNPGPDSARSAGAATPSDPYGGAKAPQGQGDSPSAGPEHQGEPVKPEPEAPKDTQPGGEKGLKG